MNQFKPFVDKIYSFIEPLFKEPKKHLKTWLVIVGVLVASWAVVFFLKGPKPTQASWWDETWLYRKAIQISNDNGEDLEDFQVAITLDTAALIAAGKMQADCDDLRITDGNGNIIPHWIEENNPGCNNSATKIWTKVPTVYDGTDATTVYAYYGNAQASNVENGDNVFEFFDDFSIDTLSEYTQEHWFSHGSAGDNWTISNSELVGGNSTNACAGIYYSDAISSNNLYIQTRVFSSDNDGYGILALDSSDNQRVSYLTNDHLGPSGFKTHVSGDTYTNHSGFTDGSRSQAAYHVFALSIAENRVNVWKDGVKILDDYSHTYSIDKIGLASLGNQPGSYFQYLLATKYVNSNPYASAPATEETSPGLVAYWKFDEGTGTTAYDSSGQGNDGTLVNGPTWQTEDMCISEKCLGFNGTDDVVTISNSVGNIKTLSFWVKPITTSEQFIDLNGSAYIQSSSGTISATGFTSPTIYVNGKVSSTIEANKWQHVVVTTNTAVSGSAIKIAQISANYGQVFIDEVKIYPYARTADQIKSDYAAGLSGQGTIKGSSAHLGGGQDSPEVSLSNGLVGYWKMDEASWNGTAGEVIDSSGNGNHGVGVGATTPTTGAGKYGNGGIFDGSDNYVNCANTTSTDITSPLTLAAWVKPTTFSTYNTILGKRTGSLATNYALRFNGSGAIEYYFGDGSWREFIWNYSLSSQWYHIAVTHDTNGNIYLYVNGVRQEPKTTIFTAVKSSQNLGIGSYNGNGPAEDFNGIIDEVRIYNRALSPAEVKALYEWAPGPVAHYTFDDSSNSSTVADISGYGNNGTWYGSSTNRYAPGKYGSAGVFNGSNDYVAVLDNNSLNIKQALTLSGWVKGDSTFGYQNVVMKGGNPPRQYSLRRNPGGDYYFYFYDSNNTSHSVSTSSNAGWEYVTGTYDGNTIKIYVNGVLKNSQIIGSYNIQQPTEAEILAIGRLGNIGAEYYNGLIDDIRIYNYARTQKQILEDMAGGAPGQARMPQPIAHWRFDEGYGTTAHDSISNKNGTIVGSSWSSDGKVNKALYFNGSASDYVSANVPEIINSSSNSFSISAWIKAESGTQSESFIAGKKGYHSGLLVPNGSSIRFQLWPSGYGTRYYASYNISTNTWYHAVATFERSTNIMSLYINGELKDTETFSGTIANYGNTLYMGGYGDSNWNFKGLIDEVKIYNYALSEDEVRQDYNQGMAAVMGQSSANTGSTAPGGSAAQEYCVPGSTDTCRPPVAEWNFEENTGTTARDTSGNGNDGTLVNMDNSNWVVGVNGSGAALRFSDSTDIINVPNLPTSTSAFTVSAWARVVKTADWGYIFHRGTNTLIGSSIIWLGVNDAGNYAASVNGRYSQGATTVTANKEQWRYLSLTYDGSSQRIYIDGQLQVTDTFGSITNSLSGNLSGIGGTPHNTSYRPIEGDIDDVRIYDYARTPAQIAWDYNRGGPVGHWRFDECQGTTAYDVSGNENHGTINIGATAPQTSAGTCSSPTNGTGAWYNGREGRLNSAMSFDGVDDYVAIANTGRTDITTLSFWAKPASTTQKIIELSASDSVEISAGTVAVTGFGTEKIYIDGTEASSFADTNWHHIAVVSSVGLTANAMNIGKVGTNYYSGLIDDVRIYNYALTPLQIKTLYNDGAVRFGE